MTVVYRQALLGFTYAPSLRKVDCRSWRRHTVGAGCRSWSSAGALCGRKSATTRGSGFSLVEGAVQRRWSLATLAGLFDKAGLGVFVLLLLGGSWQWTAELTGFRHD
jgi:hypothetical protein